MNTHLKLVILDRDGTINRASDEFVKTPEEWQPLPGALWPRLHLRKQLKRKKMQLTLRQPRKNVQRRWR